MYDPVESKPCGTIYEELHLFFISHQDSVTNPFITVILSDILFCYQLTMLFIMYVWYNHVNLRNFYLKVSQILGIFVPDLYQAHLKITRCAPQLMRCH